MQNQLKVKDVYDWLNEIAPFETAEASVLLTSPEPNMAQPAETADSASASAAANSFFMLIPPWFINDDRVCPHPQVPAILLESSGFLSKKNSMAYFYFI